MHIGTVRKIQYAPRVLYFSVFHYNFSYLLQLTTESAASLDASAFGFNASEEGGQEEVDDSSASKSGCNIVLANRLVETGFDKKGYQAHIKVRLHNFTW